MPSGLPKVILEAEGTVRGASASWDMEPGARAGGRTGMEREAFTRGSLKEEMAELTDAWKRSTKERKESSASHFRVSQEDGNTSVVN